MLRTLTARDLERVRKEFWDRKRAEAQRLEYLERNNFGFPEIIR